MTIQIGQSTSSFFVGLLLHIKQIDTSSNISVEIFLTGDLDGECTGDDEALISLDGKSITSFSR